MFQLLWKERQTGGTGTITESSLAQTTHTDQQLLRIIWFMFWITVPALPYTQHPCEQCESAGGQQNTVCSSLKRKGGATYPRKAVLWPQKWSFVAHTIVIRVIHLNNWFFLVKGQVIKLTGATRNYLKWKSQQYQEWVLPLLVLLPWVQPAVFSSNQATDIRLVCVCPLH